MVKLLVEYRIYFYSIIGVDCMDGFFDVQCFFNLSMKI